MNEEASSSTRPAYGGPVETIRSGAAYVYRRRKSDSLDFCTGSLSECIWEQEVKVMASDKRSNAMFGHSVSIDDTSGILVVGSPGASLTGFYKEAPTIYPFVDATGASNTMGMHYPISPELDYLLQNLPAYAPQPSGAQAAWYLMGPGHGNPEIAAESGSMYIFTRENAQLSGSGSVLQAPHWYSTENFKTTAPDVSTRDRFGTSVVLDGDMLVSGAPGNDGMGSDIGALYFYQSGFAAFSFAQVSSDEEFFPASSQIFSTFLLPLN